MGMIQDSLSAKSVHYYNIINSYRKRIYSFPIAPIAER